ncbi:MAG: helix-turn-helix domain-containing protein [Pseudomonadota bacterium]
MVNYVETVIAVCAIIQALFLCMLLRGEGVRALRANRWMMVFVITAALNMSEEVIEILASPQMTYYGALFFLPVNFAIAPAIYLYFREISGTPSRYQWLHFLPVAIMFNLVAWIFVYNGAGMPEGGVLAPWDAMGYRKLPGFFPYGLAKVQAAVYLVLIWKAGYHYFRQTQEQLGADRAAMRVWVTSIVGSITFIFATLVVSKSLFSGAFTGLSVQASFLIMFLILSYILATRPVLFVMPRWPEDDEAEDDNDDALGNVVLPALATRSGPEGAPRALVDEDTAALVVRRLGDIRRAGDLLLDPLVSLPKLARAVGVSTNQLSYVLNHHVGQNFFDYVNGARIEEARAVLIAEPDRTILDVALSVGFNSKSTFNLAFRKLTGETPSTLRRKESGQLEDPSESRPENRTEVA